MNAFGKSLAPVLIVSLVAGCAGLPSESESSRAKPMPRSKVLDIRAAQEQLAGKTMPEVLRAVGSPSRQNGNSEWEWWTYEETFFDPITQRILPVVTLVFRDGRLLEISF